MDEALRHFAAAVTAGSPYWHIEDYDECLADAYAVVGRLDAAIKEYERVLALNPNRPITRFRFAQTLDRAGQPDRAVAEYRAFLDGWRNADPDLPELRIARQRLASGAMAAQ